MFVRTLIGRQAGQIVEIAHLAAVQMLKDGRAELPEPLDEGLVNAAPYERQAPVPVAAQTTPEPPAGPVCARCGRPKHRGFCKKGT